MNHSHGYEMRLQKARELRREENEHRTAARDEKRRREEALDALVRAVRAAEKLPEVLAAYEATGDHDHSWTGNRPIPVGAPCPGGDCWVARARELITRLA